MTMSLEGFPDVERILELYSRSISTYGGKPSKPTVGCIEGALGNAINAAHYSDSSSDSLNILLIAAYVFRSLARNHCFSDGNKRIAWLSLTEVLACCAGLDVVATDEEVVSFCEEVAQGHVDVESVLSWLADGERLRELTIMEKG
jgi:death on curing protein